MIMVSKKKWRGRPYPPRRDGAVDLKRRVILLIAAGFLVVAVLVGAGFAFYNGLTRSVFFQLTAIKIQGSQRVGNGTILELSGVDIHSNLLKLNRQAVEERLAAHPWIKGVEVQRDWPNRLLITVKERKPVALFAGGERFFFVDVDGAIFASAEPGDDLDFPVISGMTRQAWEAADSAGPRGDILRLFRKAGRGDSNLPLQNISELHVDKDGNVVMFLADRPFPIYFGRGDMEVKFGRVAKVLGWLYKKKQFQETIAIRLDDLEKKVLVERASSG
jgi:cell division septal protein FtsQ